MGAVRRFTGRWHETASLLLAGLATPLVLSVHTIVSFDFAFAIVPGWHATIFPPYFVAGAIYAGFAMVLTLSIPIRKSFSSGSDFITMRHLDNMGKVLAFATGLIVGYGYMMEARVLQRQPVRTLHDFEPHDWPICRDVLDADRW